MTSGKSELYCSNSDVIFLVTSSSLHKNQLVDKNLPFLINDNACNLSMLHPTMIGVFSALIQGDYFRSFRVF